MALGWDVLCARLAGLNGVLVPVLSCHVFEDMFSGVGFGTRLLVGQYPSPLFWPCGCTLPTGAHQLPALVQGGLCHKTVHVPTHIQALQAMVISRLLEPERLVWKVFQSYHLSHWAMGPASCLARSRQPSGNCQLGCQPTWRPSGLFILTAFNQSLPCCHRMS